MTVFYVASGVAFFIVVVTFISERIKAKQDRIAFDKRMKAMRDELDRRGGDR